MKRILFLTVLASALPFACTASLDESCISGPCEAGKPLSGSSTSGGEGGAGGAGGVAEVGGGGAGGGGPSCDPNAVPITGDFPCEVFNVLVTQCHKCHTSPAKGGAPFPLLTYEDTHMPYGSKRIWQQMQADIESGYMPLGEPDDLEGTELKTMQDWFAQCAPPAPDGMGCEEK